MGNDFTKLLGDAPTAPFPRRLDLFLSGSTHWNIVWQFKKDVSNSATQDSIMNVHNKTQLTHARINYILNG
ncbi:hypothetical protein H5410_056987 [Solanum commersonii]|uniref:Uncharacterized protein n=1 Tax=Solanum commersonii TaxID=4109 RepID=A0A9J5WND0_SOLCO|nr:hypothetical protein H5410_056987 [Solanum commersonii]